MAHIDWAPMTDPSLELLEAVASFDVRWCEDILLRFQTTYQNCTFPKTLKSDASTWSGTVFWQLCLINQDCSTIGQVPWVQSDLKRYKGCLRSCGSSICDIASKTWLAHCFDAWVKYWNKHIACSFTIIALHSHHINNRINYTRTYLMFGGLTENDVLL